MMDKILQKSVKMPVRLAEENMELRPNEVYLNIPGMILEVESGHLHLSPVHDRVQRYAPINQMLNSLASDKNIHTIAVILSGSGSDGTIGIGSVKENGGTITVSYTHLDVYKRQRPCLCVFRKAGWAPWFSRAQVPPAPSWLNC